MHTIKWFFNCLCLIILLYVQNVSAQDLNPLTKENETEKLFKLVNKDSITVQKKSPVLPVNLTMHQGVSQTLKIDLIKIVSSDNNIIPLKYKIEPASIEMFPDKIGKVFNIYFNAAEFEHINPGMYTAYISIISSSKFPQNVKFKFEVQDDKEIFSSFTRFIQSVRDNFIGLIWKIFEILFFLFIIGIIIWFSRLAIKGKNSLNVLSIVNETGSGGEMEGVASGIDDILITNLQDIAQKSQISQIKHYWLSTHEGTIEREDEFITAAKAQLMNVQGGGPSFGLQKMGDISIGPVKIPLGEIIAFITKIFGGNYVSGALQKYGKINKIVLKLEKKPSIFSLKLDISYFEVTWPSENIKIKNIAEGVPTVIEELAYRITLNISGSAGTDNWKAYKCFLDGVLAFHYYEVNRTRKDYLKDSINHWRESVRLDPHFAKAHYNLGVALDMDQKYEEALFRYEKVIAMSPELVGAEAHYNIAKLYWDIYKDREKTMQELNKAKEIDPGLPETYNLLGLVYSNKFEDQKAFEMYEEAIRRSNGEPNPTYYYNQCVAKYHLKEYKAAKSIGQKVLNLYGSKEKEKAILQTMGMVHIKLGDYEKALEYFEKGLLKDPGNRDMLHGYGVALESCNEYDKALIVLRRLVRLWPEFGGGYAEIANILSKQNYNTEEINAYETIGNVLSGEEIWTKTNKRDHQNFIKYFSEKVNLANATVLKKKIYYGILGSIVYYLFRKETEAVKIFEAIFSKENLIIQTLLDVEFWHNYGFALLALAKQSNNSSNFDMAANALNNAVKLYNAEQIYDIAQCRTDLAELHNNNKKYLDADAEFIVSIDLYKKIGLTKVVSDLYVKDANCLINAYLAREGGVQLYDLARKACNYAIHYNNSNYSAFHVKGNTYYDFKQYAEAIPEFEKAIEINFDLPGAHYNLGLCYLYMGKYEKAAAKFKTTIKLDELYADPENSNKPDPYKRLSECYEKLGQPSKAVPILRKISDIYPRSAKYNLLLGQYLVKMNQYDEAANQFIDCLDFDKDNLQKLKHLALNSLADLYTEQGADIDLAYAMSRRALVMYKPQAVIHKRRSEIINAQLLTDRDLSSIRNTLGWIFYQKGKVVKAMLFLEKSIVHALGEAKAHARLAYAYEKYAKICSESLIADIYEKARNQWKIVLSLDCDEQLNQFAKDQLQTLGQK